MSHESANIYCVHKWTRKLVVAPSGMNNFEYTYCPRCAEIWHENKPEPQTIIARIEAK